MDTATWNDIHRINNNNYAEMMGVINLCKTESLPIVSLHHISPDTRTYKLGVVLRNKTDLKNVYSCEFHRFTSSNNSHNIRFHARDLITPGGSILPDQRPPTAPPAQSNDIHPPTAPPAQSKNVPPTAPPAKSNNEPPTAQPARSKNVPPTASPAQSNNEPPTAQPAPSNNVPLTAPPAQSNNEPPTASPGWSNNVQTLSPHSDTSSKELLSPNSPTKKQSDGPIEHVFLTPGNHIQHQHPISQLTNSYGLMNIDEVNTNAANQVMINSSNDSIRTAVVNIGDIGTFKFEGEDHDVMVILENILPMVKFLDGSILPFDADLRGNIIDENSKRSMINSS
eukprot:scaffold52669_cov40-Cyclotella_meneghiniana.AAC.2